MNKGNEYKSNNHSHTHNDNNNYTFNIEYVQQ